MSNCNHKLLVDTARKSRRNVSVDNFTAPSSHFVPVIISPHVSESIKRRRWIRHLAAHLICAGFSLIFFLNFAFEFDKTSANECGRIELCVAPYDVFEWMLLAAHSPRRRPRRRREKAKNYCHRADDERQTHFALDEHVKLDALKFRMLFQFRRVVLFFIFYFVKIKNSTFLLIKKVSCHEVGELSTFAKIVFFPLLLSSEFKFDFKQRRLVLMKAKIVIQLLPHFCHQQKSSNFWFEREKKSWKTFPGRGKNRKWKSWHGMSRKTSRLHRRSLWTFFFALLAFIFSHRPELFCVGWEMEGKRQEIGWCEAESSLMCMNVMKFYLHEMAKVFRFVLFELRW